jgi:hypothetical protein
MYLLIREQNIKLLGKILATIEEKILEKYV